MSKLLIVMVSGTVFDGKLKGSWKFEVKGEDSTTLMDKLKSTSKYILLPNTQEFIDFILMEKQESENHK